ncbi:hypothetical protein ACFVP8_03905 [Viridibacillus arvi]|uniref:hypothetical protein n=1 Tax=Viridibacillus arvi TaxID=263475 RepID=UPI00367F8B02
MTYTLCKNIINGGNYEYQSMLTKLDVFLLGNRITSTQYTELSELMDSQQDAGE